MVHVTDKGAGFVEREYLREVRRRLEDGLGRLDQHHRLRGRPMTFRITAPRTIEIVYRDVTRIEESELLGLKKVLGTTCYCSVEPQTAETLTVRIVVSVPEPT
jgi:hypothetical protein